MTQELAAGSEFGSYRILSIIGRGGMGVVYLAEDTGLDRRVALKVLAAQYTTDAAFRARFERESRLAAALDHPNVVPVYDAGEIEGVLFIAMRYVAGADLRVVLDRDGQFDASRALGISAQLASALDAAHNLGLIHRDVKPANVLVSDSRGVDGGEHVYLSDFGLTKHSASKSGLTQLGQLVGTIDYIAPEQMAGGAIDGRADIYALGCVFYEMLAGKPPFARDSDLATMAAHLHEPPPSLTAARPDLAPAADAVIARVLAKDPGQRYPTAAEFVRDARRALLPGAAPRVAAATAVAAQTVISPAPVAPTSATATATIVNANAPSPTPSAAPPPTGGPPPDLGAFASSGGAPPYTPTGQQSYQPPPKPRRSVPMAVILGAVGLGILLVAGVALALAGAPNATPTSVAQVSPSAPVSLSPTSQPTFAPSATALATTPASTPAQTSPPTTPLATAIATATATSAPTAPPPTPTSPPPPTATPGTAYDRLLAMLSPADVPLASCTENTQPIFGIQPVSRATCTTGPIERDYVVLKDSSEVDTVWTSFDILPRNVCPGYEGGAWHYGSDAADLTRGKIACGLPGGVPQLVFTYDDLHLIGVFQETLGSTKDAITAAFTEGNGVIPQ